MTFNPDIHRRRSIRLRDYDYSHAGAYFVTICTFQREGLFGDVMNGAMRLNDAGQMVKDSWRQILTHFSGVNIDQYVIMPNHFHGIVTIVGAGSPRPVLSDTEIEGGEIPPLRRATLGQIVGFFKYQSTKRINTLRDNPGAPVWQRNYYERVIRDDRELHGIRQYIGDNPLRWEEDENHPARQTPIL